MKGIWPYVCLFAGMSTVGSYVALSKPLALSIPIFVLAGLRFSLAGLAMLAWLKPSPNALPLPSSAKRWLFVQSFLGNFLFSICMLYGVVLSSAVTAGIVMAAIPAAVAVLSWMVLREKISFRTWLAIGLVCMAVLCLQFSKTDPTTQPHYAIGITLLIAAVLCEASYVVLAKRLSGHLDPKRNSALLNAWGWALTMPLALWQWWDTDFSMTSISLLNWGLLVYYALAASVISTFLWFTGLKHIPASRAGVFTVALPMTASLLGITVLNEPFTLWHGLAMALALTGVLLASTESNPTSKIPAATDPN